MGLPLPWPFDRDYMQLALAAGLVVGASGPLIGAFLVQKRLALMGDGLGHLAFAGIAAGLLLEVWPVWTALVAAVVGAVAIEWLRSRGRASGDLALALFFYGGLALGAVLSSRATGADANVVSWLFGSILTVGPADVWTVVALGTFIVASVVVAGPAMLAVVLDEEAARVAGLPVDVLNTLLAVSTSVTIVAAMRVVGVLLVAALMVLPVAASRLLARSFRRTLTVASAIGAGSVVVGLWVARRFALAPGGTIVLVAAAVFAAVAALRAGTGAHSPQPPGTGRP